MKIHVFLEEWKEFEKIPISYRYPYYVKCSFCGTEIAGNTPEEVANEAREEGWKYYYDKDLILCPDCRIKMEEKEEK